MEGGIQRSDQASSKQDDQQALSPGKRSKAASLPSALTQSLGSSMNMRSPSMEAYTALYKSDATAPESPFSRSSSMTAMQTFSSISSQGSRRLSPPNHMHPSRTLSSSLSSPNLKGLMAESRSMSIPLDSAPLDTVAEQGPSSSAPIKKRFLPRQGASSLPDRDGRGLEESWQRYNTSGAGKQQPPPTPRLRSRERRRAQVEELDDLQAVLRYNIALQTRAVQLERNVARKDREIAALTAELRALDAARPGGSDGGAADAGPEKSGGHSSEEGSGDVQPQPHSRDFARLCLQSQVARLAQLAAAQDLRNADPTGEGLPAEVLDEVREEVARGCAVAEAVLQLPQSRAVLPFIMLELSAVLPSQAATWRAALKVVRLSERQRAQILEWRRSTCARVQAVQKERQRCVAQMLQLLAPEGLLLQSSAPQVFCGRLMAEGALPLAKVNLDTMEHIKSLKGNLKEEQQVFMKANTVLLTQLLSPVQAALLMLQCWPAHCDCFGFANFVASEAAQASPSTSLDCCSQPSAFARAVSGASTDEMEE